MIRNILLLLFCVVALTTADSDLQVLNTLNVSYFPFSLQTHNEFVYVVVGNIYKYDSNLRLVQSSPEPLGGIAFSIIDNSTAIGYYTTGPILNTNGTFIYQIDLENLTQTSGAYLEMNTSWAITDLFISQTSSTPTTMYATVMQCFLCATTAIISFDYQTGAILNSYFDPSADFAVNSGTWIPPYGTNQNKAGYLAFLDQNLYIFDLDSFQMVESFPHCYSNFNGQALIVRPGYLGWMLSGNLIIFDLQKGAIINKLEIFNYVNYTAMALTSDGQGSIYLGYSGWRPPIKQLIHDSYFTKISFSSSLQLEVVSSFELPNNNIGYTDSFGPNTVQTKILEDKIFTFSQANYPSQTYNQIIEIGNISN